MDSMTNRSDKRSKHHRPVRVFVLSRRGQGADQVRRGFEQDGESEPASYGFNLAEKTGWSIAYSQDKPATRWSDAFFKKFEFDFGHALDNLRAIRRADIIWTMLEWEWLAVALLQRLKLAPRRQVIANSVWLADKWKGHSPRKRAFLRWLLLPHFDMTLHSKRGLAYLRSALPDVSWRVSPFGISTKGFPITPPSLDRPSDRPIRVYSIGNDGTRDWSTMLEAFGNDPRFEVTIVCRWLDARTLERYANLRSPSNMTVSRQRDEYLKADVVVVPMVENDYSGITVAMEAVAMGKPVVSTATGGVDTYFDENEVLFVPPGDPMALRDAVLTTSDADFLARAQRAQSRFVQAGYDAESMIDRYIAATTALLGFPQTDQPEPS